MYITISPLHTLNLGERHLKDGHICCHGNLQVVGQFLSPTLTARLCLLSTSADKIRLTFASPGLAFAFQM